jgi:hypothetical protein
LFTLFKPKKHTGCAATSEEQHMPTTLRDQGLPMVGSDYSAAGMPDKAEYLISRFSRYAGVALFMVALGFVVYLIV